MAHPITMGISKSKLPAVKKRLTKEGYRGLTTRLSEGGYYNVYYTHTVQTKKGKIHGYEAQLSGKRNFKARSIKHFTSKIKAKKYAKAQAAYETKSTGNKIYYRVVPKVFTKCRCGRTMDVGDQECLRCEEMRLGY